MASTLREADIIAPAIMQAAYMRRIIALLLTLVLVFGLIGCAEKQYEVTIAIEYTYFTFVMPNEDVLVEIEDRWVDIPEAQE